MFCSSSLSPFKLRSRWFYSKINPVLPFFLLAQWRIGSFFHVCLLSFLSESRPPPQVPLFERSVACLAYPSSVWICYYFIFWTVQGSLRVSSMFKERWLYSTDSLSFIPRYNSIFLCRTCQLCDQCRSSAFTSHFPSFTISYRGARNNFNLFWRISFYSEEYVSAILEGSAFTIEWRSQ